MIQAKLNSIISNNNYIPYGAYTDTIHNTPTQIFPKNTPIQSRRLKRKAWFFIGGYSNDLYIGLAIIDAGYLAKAFCYIYDTKTGEFTEDEITVPFGFKNSFDPSFNHKWQLKNYKINAQNDTIIATIQTKKFNLDLQLKNNTNGVSFFCPSEKNRPFHYTYKNLLLSGRLNLKLNGKVQTFNNLKFGIDFSKGFPPRYTFWNWASFQGVCDDGTEIAMNLVDGFNNNLENVIWVNQKPKLTSMVKFTYSKPLAKSNWSVCNQELELTLTPQGARNENINLLLVKSKFTQVFGNIKGKILIDDQWKNLKGHGVMEEHEAKW
ncbi:DUF2804 domain-containing protein [Francisellaceae bacterium]|nr:DUF2804 domain-containing protein [Francisellaceae bacterium]